MTLNGLVEKKKTEHILDLILSHSFIHYMYNIIKCLFHLWLQLLGVRSSIFFLYVENVARVKKLSLSGFMHYKLEDS